MALVVVIWKGRLKRTLWNIARLLERCSACGCQHRRYRSTIAVDEDSVWCGHGADGAGIRVGKMMGKM